MRVYIDKLFEEFANQNLRNVDWHKHVLPKTDNDAMDDFVHQDFDIGKTDRPLYPMFPYMSEEEYENNADKLRLSNADGFINYNVRINNKTGVKNARPRAVKYRRINLPATPHDREFYEMVVYSLSDDTVIGYYLCRKNRIDREKRTAVYDLKGNPTKENSELRKQLRSDYRAWREVCDFIDKQDVTDECLTEAYSQTKTLKNRFGSAIGFVRTDPSTGNQILLNRFGSVRGYYNAKTDTTQDRLGRLYGRGNLLMLLMQSDKQFTESVEDKDIDQYKLKQMIIHTLEYLDNNAFEFPQKRYLPDGWADWAEEYSYDTPNLGRLLEDAYNLIDYLEPYLIEDGDDVALTEVAYYYRRLKELSHQDERMNESSGESKAKRLFKDPKKSRIKTFAIFTAENPDKQTFIRKTNKELGKQLKSDISYGGIEKDIRSGYWHYYKVKGKYDNVEHSLIVYNIALDDAKRLSAKYGQQSFIYGTNNDGKLTFSFYANRKKNGHEYIKVDEKDSFDILDDNAENYYTQISRDFKISIPFDVFEVAAEDMEESLSKRQEKLKWNDNSIMKCIDEGMDENINLKNRYFARATIHEKY